MRLILALHWYWVFLCCVWILFILSLLFLLVVKDLCPEQGDDGAGAAAVWGLLQTDAVSGRVTVSAQSHWSCIQSWGSSTQSSTRVTHTHTSVVWHTVWSSRKYDIQLDNQQQQHVYNIQNGFQAVLTIEQNGGYRPSCESCLELLYFSID